MPKWKTSKELQMLSNITLSYFSHFLFFSLHSVSFQLLEYQWSEGKFFINKPAAARPDASDNSMTEATSMLSIAKVTVWSHWQCNFLVIRLFDHQIGWSLLPILLSCTFVHRSYQRQESHLARLAKSHGANYGKPKPGSESEKRSIAYQVDY